MPKVILNVCQLKQSNETWLGQVPIDWDLVPAKRLFREISVKNCPNEPLLSATQEYGVVPRDMLPDRVMMPMGDLVGFKLVTSGDFVISLRSFQGGIEYSEYQGLVSPAYTVIRPTTNINARFFAYLMKSYPFVLELNKAITGIRDGKNISYREFERIVLPVPPREEQDALVAFLYDKLAYIDRYISAKQRLIELLNEQKTVIINQAITEGLNSDVEMQESGIDWLGKIPAHWMAKRAKFLFREVNERSETGKEELLSVSHITGVTPRSQKNVYMFMAETYEGYKTCVQGDLVINIMWAWMGALGVSEYSGIVSSSYGVYRPRYPQLFRRRYLDLLLRTKAYIAEYNCRSTGITSSRLRMYTDDFFKIPIVYPPLSEQDEILRHIDRKTEKLNLSISKAEREIELMQEFRTALIAEAVTGKIDVFSRYQVGELYGRR